MRRLVLLVCLALSLGVAAPAHAQEAPWTIVPIDPPQGYSNVTPTAINNNGLVVGAVGGSGFSSYAFAWNGTAFTVLPDGPDDAAGDQASAALDVNDSGLIVGHYSSTAAGGPVPRGVQWQNGAVFAAYERSIGPSSSPLGTTVGGVNEAGRSTGRGWRDAAGTAHDAHVPFIATGTAMTSLFAPGSDPAEGAGIAINESDDVLVIQSRPGGNNSLRSAVWSGGSPTFYDIYPGLQGLNDSRQVVGEVPDGEAATLTARMWDGTKLVELECCVESRGNAINNHGTVTGVRGGVAWLWRPGAGGASLASLAGNPGGWSFQTASDVNDKGVVVGVGTFNGAPRAFMAIPPSGGGNPPPPPGGGNPPPGGGNPPPAGGGGGQQPPPGPTVTGPAGNPLGLPTRRKCVDTRKFSFRLHHAPGARIVKVEVFINGKRKIVKTGTNIRRLTLKKLPKKKFRVRIVATQNTGSKLISVRTYRGCKKSRARTRRGGRRR